MEGHRNFLRGFGELFECEGVWWFFFEEYKLGYFCERFNVKCARSAYHDGNDFDVGCSSAICLEGLFEWVVYVIDVVYHLLCVTVRGVFAFDDL